jgi:hypothetical protein
MEQVCIIILQFSHHTPLHLHLLLLQQVSVLQWQQQQQLDSSLL